MNPLDFSKTISIFFVIMMSLFHCSNVFNSMQDATPSSTDSQRPDSSVESLQKENQKLKDKLSWFETEYKKLAAIIAMQHKRPEKHISLGASPWLPFDSQEELAQAKIEAEAEAQKIIDENKANSETKPPKKRTESLPKHLPVIKQLCDVPEQERVCPEHGPMTQIGTDSTKTLVQVPSKLYCLEREFPIYACSCCKEHGVVSAERPTGLVEGNKYDTSIAATVVTQKYDLHLPLYRQTDVFAVSGWTPSRSTLLNLMQQVDFVLEPFVAYMSRLVKADQVVGIDESSCRMLMPQDEIEAKPGDLKTKRLVEKIAEAKAAGHDSIIGKMWAYRGIVDAPYNIFDFRVSRHRDGPSEFFTNSRCVVQGDCFSGNTSIVLESAGRLTFAACMAHARRKIYDLDQHNPHRATLLEMIQGLYDINAREEGMSVEARTEHRLKNAVPLLAAIRKYMDSLTEQAVLPKSELGQALGYWRNHWEALNAYSTDGRVPIDNNRVEQLMREVAIGRKNWLFVGNVAAGERSARLMSVVSSAKRHQLDAWLYLKEMLDRLLAGETDYSQFLPDVWKREHPEAVRQYRVEESRQKADRKKLTRAKRVIAAKFQREQTERQST